MNSQQLPCRRERTLHCQFPGMTGDHHRLVLQVVQQALLLTSGLQCVLCTIIIYFSLLIFSQSLSSSYVPDPGRNTPSAAPQQHPHLLSPNFSGIALPSQPDTQQQQRQQPRFVETPTVPNSPNHFDRPALWPPASPSADRSPSRSGSGIPFGSGSLRNDSGSHGPPVIPASQPTAQIGERRMMSPANAVSTDHASSHGGSVGMNNLDGSGRLTPNNAGIGAGGGMRGVDLHHMPSNTSLRSSKSYARYDPSTYLDPAYYESDGR
jgi:hypothetical protein